MIGVARLPDYRPQSGRIAGLEPRKIAVSDRAGAEQDSIKSARRHAAVSQRKLAMRAVFSVGAASAAIEPRKIYRG